MCSAAGLRETDGTVSETLIVSGRALSQRTIAYASGFETVPHFTRRFRARFGVTPAACRLLCASGARTMI